MTRRDTMALAFMQTLLAMPRKEFDQLDYQPAGLLVKSKDDRGADLPATAVLLADRLIEELDQ